VSPPASAAAFSSAAVLLSAQISPLFETAPSSVPADRSRRFLRRAAHRRHAFASLSKGLSAPAHAAQPAAGPASSLFASPLATFTTAAPSPAADAASVAAAAVSEPSEFDGLTIARRWSELNQQGMASLQAGTAPDLDAAERCFREAALITAHVATTTPYRALSMANLGSCLVRKGRCDDALHIFLPLIPELKRHNTVSPAQVAMVHMECATAYELLGSLDAAATEIGSAAAVFLAAVDRAAASLVETSPLTAPAPAVGTPSAERLAQLASDATTAFRTSLGCRFRGAVLQHRQRLWKQARSQLVALAIEYRALIDILATQRAHPGKALAVRVPEGSVLNVEERRQFLAYLHTLPAELTGELVDASAVDLINVMLSLASVNIDLYQVSAACATYEEVAKFALLHSPQNFMGVLSEASKTLRATAQVSLPKNARAPNASESYASVLKEVYAADLERAGVRPTEAGVLEAMDLTRSAGFTPQRVAAHADGLSEVKAALSGAGADAVATVESDDSSKGDAVAASAAAAAEEDDDAIVFTKRGKRTSTAALARDAEMKQLFTSDGARAAGAGAAAAEAGGAPDTPAPEDVMAVLMASELADIAPMMSKVAVTSAAASLRTLRRIDATRAYFGKLFSEYAKKEAANRDSALASAEDKLGALPENVRRAIEEQASVFSRAIKEGAAAAAAAGEVPGASAESATK
jgi:hypothetical protein